MLDLRRSPIGRGGNGDAVLPHAAPRAATTDATAFVTGKAPALAAHETTAITAPTDGDAHLMHLQALAHQTAELLGDRIIACLLYTSRRG